MKMIKILWFTNSPSQYDQGKHPYHGAGWIESLEELLKQENNLDLAVSFFHPSDYEKTHKRGTTYYPILREPRKKSPLKYILNVWSGDDIIEKKLKVQMLSVIEDFRPDVIHVFGSEGLFASIQQYTNIPVVIHLQGIINPLVNSYFPAGHGVNSLKFNKFFFIKNSLGLGKLSDYRRFQKQAKREATNLKYAKYIMGRTDWDKRVAKIYNPQVSYFHVDEVLRPLFYQNYDNTVVEEEKITILSTLSPTIYKGIDVVLKAAKLLKNETSIAFEWKIVGLDNDDKLLKYFISNTDIQPESVGLQFLGKKSPEDLVALLGQASIFVHPSYIDNSPNSVCEAQMMGVPIIACNVGGLSSIIEHKETGVLVPSNGVFEIVSWIIELNNNLALRDALSQKEKVKAQIRHNRNKIISDLIDVYTKIKDS
jgi:glycosyltransferase involved in cell wall biosynthesis